MPLSNFLAELWGISLVLISLSLQVNPENIKKLFLIAKDEAYIFWCGVTCVIAGSAMVISHNIWAKNWTIAITILGWLLLIRGAVALFFPETIKKMGRKIESSPYLSYGLFAIVFIGLILAYLGFTA